MPQPGDTGDHRLALISEMRRNARELLDYADQLEAEITAPHRAVEQARRRRFRLIRGSGVAVAVLTLKRAILHVHGTTTAAILTAAASGALITAAAVTAPTSSPPIQQGPGVTVTESAPPNSHASTLRPATTPPLLPEPSTPPALMPSGVPGLPASPSATPTLPLPATPAPGSITPAVPTPAVVVQPPSRRRRRRPGVGIPTRLPLPAMRPQIPACPCLL